MRRMVVAFGIMSLLASCTEPGETTGIAAATGGAVGAGLGAIIGSQTGNAGAGLILGGVGGAATGAALGNVIEAKQEIIRTQDEAIERQEKSLALHRSEIEELRRAGQESVGFRAPSSGSVESARAMPKPGAFTSSKAAVGQGGGGLREADITPVKPSIPPLRETPPVPVARQVAETRAAVKWDSASATHGIPSTPECVRAQGEVAKADAVRESADKLFHVRRALRFCPESAALNNSLGELYLVMNRKQDAEFAFREAVRLEPGFAPAQKNLLKFSKR